MFTYITNVADMLRLVSKLPVMHSGSPQQLAFANHALRQRPSASQRGPLFRECICGRIINEATGIDSASLELASDIGRSTSVFGRRAEGFLNIRILETNMFINIIGDIKYNEDDINQGLKDLFLESFNRDQIRTYNPRKHTDLSKSAQTFLYKLHLVVSNNFVDIEPMHVEAYIHDLMNNILKAAKFEDGADLILRPCILRLQLGLESFAAYADKEGRRGTEIIWVIDEDKHRFDRRWKRGDVQLIANMIAAVQYNESQLKRIYPTRMLGIKFDADCLYFYSATITNDYLNDLVNRERPGPLVVYKFPPENRELSLSIAENRKELFLYLSALRKYALSLEPVYVD